MTSTRTFKIPVEHTTLLIYNFAIKNYMEFMIALFKIGFVCNDDLEVHEDAIEIAFQVNSELSQKKYDQMFKLVKESCSSFQIHYTTATP